MVNFGLLSLVRRQIRPCLAISRAIGLPTLPSTGLLIQAGRSGAARMEVTFRLFLDFVTTFRFPATTTVTVASMRLFFDLLKECGISHTRQTAKAPVLRSDLMAINPCRKFSCDSL